MKDSLSVREQQHNHGSSALSLSAFFSLSPFGCAHYVGSLGEAVHPTASP